MNPSRFIIAAFVAVLMFTGCSEDSGLSALDETEVALKTATQNDAGFSDFNNQNKLFLSKKGAKLEVCHVDQDTGEIKLISVGSSNALDKHLANHAGDGLPGVDYDASCQPLPTVCAITPEMVQRVGGTGPIPAFTHEENGITLSFGPFGTGYGLWSTDFVYNGADPNFAGKTVNAFVRTGSYPFIAEYGCEILGYNPNYPSADTYDKLLDVYTAGYLRIVQ